MTLLGKIIKTGIDLNQKLDFGKIQPGADQKKQLKSLLEKSKDTAFGKYYGFAKILQEVNMEEAFKKAVPVFDYNKLHQEWWGRQEELPDITWPGKPSFFALSSGTTGKSSKRIPITEEFLDSMRKVGTSLIKSLPNFEFPESLFESEILMLSSSADLKQNKSGKYEGEISGINVSNFPKWYDLFYRPGKEIASIANWDERVERIAQEAPGWDVGAIAGIPSWVLLMLRKIVDKHNLDSIHDIWPNFKVYASGGVAYETYRKDFDQLCSQPITVIDTYLASEGFFAYTSRPDTMAMTLATDHGYYYEFIPFDERGVDDQGQLIENPESLSIEEVEEDQEYVLVVSTCAGAWRYTIGDVIKFESVNPPEIRITGRTKFFLNVVGSQLSEEKMDSAILEVGEKLGVNVNEYMVAAMKNQEGEYIHHWVLVSDSDIDSDAFAENLDESLSEANKNYKVARSKALKGIEVKTISKKQYHDYLKEKKKKGGQVKTPKVMKAGKMEDLIGFVSA